MTRRVWTAAAVVLASSAVARADVSDVAELFPATTLAYAEVGRPGDVTKVLGGWAKGTPLEDGLRFVHDRKDAVKEHKSIPGLLPVGVANLLVSPEFLSEIGKFRGAAVGLTGFSDKHEPQAAAVVLFGDSTAAGLLTRGFLTTNATLRRVDTVDGVPVFQHRAFPPFGYGNDGKPLPLENPKPTEGRCEATYAYRPGLFVVGTSKAAVADVLARFAGKAAKPSLAAAPVFKRFADDRKKPGVFAYAVPAALTAALDKVRKEDREAFDGDALSAVNFVLNPKALPVVAGNLTVREDELVLSLRGDVAAGQASPLFALLAASSVPASPPSADAAGAVTLSLPRPADRAKTILAFADACAKSGGRLGPLPSEQVAESDKAGGVNLREDILRRVASVTVVVPVRQELPRGVTPLPLAVVHTDTEADAAALAELVPKLVSLVAGSDKPAGPAAEVIGGVRVFSLPGTSLRQDAPIHYARAGKAVVLGLDRKWVARVASEPGKGTFVAADGPALSGSFRLGPLVRLTEPAPAQLADRAKAIPVPGPRPNDTVEVPPSNRTLLAAALEPLPPATVRIGVGKDGFAVEVAVRGFKGKLPVVTEKLVRWLEKAGAEAFPGDGSNIPPGGFDR